MRPLKLLIGVLLLPLCFAVSRAFVDVLRLAQPSSAGPAILWLGGGLVIWLIVYFAMPRPVRAYVLAHELSHAVWGLAMGARVSKLNVNAGGGSVNLSKSNFLIALAPYFFPLYTVLLLLVHAVLGWFYNLERYEPFWLAMVGLTWCFHLTFTLSALLREQPDITEHGRLFSYSVIYLFNVAGIVLWLVAVTPASVADGFGALAGRTTGAYETAWSMMLKLVALIRSHAGR